MPARRLLLILAFLAFTLGPALLLSDASQGVLGLVSFSPDPQVIEQSAELPD